MTGLFWDELFTARMIVAHKNTLFRHVSYLDPLWINHLTYNTQPYPSYQPFSVELILIVQLKLFDVHFKPFNKV